MQDLKKQSPLGVYIEHCKQGELAYQVAGDGKPVFFPRLFAPGANPAPANPDEQGLADFCKSFNGRFGPSRAVP